MSSIRRTSCVAAIVAMGVGLFCLPAASSRKQPSTKSAESTDPSIVRARTVHRQIKILKTIREDAKRATEEQAKAIAVLADFRSKEAVSELLRVVLVKNALSKEAVIASSGGMRASSGGLFVLRDHPAARALVSIGLPAVEAILDDVEKTEAKKQDKKRLEVYSAILSRVLVYHARAYVLEEKKRARKGLAKNYDRLLALRHMTVSWPVVRPEP